MAEKRKSNTAAKGRAAQGKNHNAKSSSKNSRTKSAADEEKNKGLSSQAKAIIMLAVAALMLCVIIFKNESVWLEIHNVFGGLFGFCGFVWPLLLIYVAVMTALERKIHGKTAGKLALAIGSAVCISTLIYVFNVGDNNDGINFFQELGRLYTQGVNYAGAGLLSGIIGIPLVMLCGTLGAQIVTVIALITLLLLLFSVSIKNVLQAAKKPVDRVKKAAIEERDRRREQRKRRSTDKNGDIYALGDSSDSGNEFQYESQRQQSFEVDIPLDTPKKSGKKHNTKLDELNAAWENANSDAPSKSESKAIPAASAAAQEAMEKKKKPKKSSPDQLQPDPQTVPVEADKAGEKERVDGDSGYRYPPIELLAPNPDEYSDSTGFARELRESGDKLVSTLESFGVRSKIIDIARGPAVTRFELQPAAGIKISKITNLSQDIAMNLAAESVRIEAPIPGKAAVGIEIPNKSVSMVTMRELIASQQFRSAKSKLAAVLGKDISGNIVITDLAKMPHLLIAGTTGSGKSVCVNSLLLSILYKASPDEVKIVLIDPKMVEFSKYKGVPHLLIPVVSDVKKAAGALNWAVSEMLNRYKTFAAYGVRDIEGYNKMVDTYRKKYKDLPPDTPKEDLPLTDSGLPIPEKKLEKIVIAIDELADLMMEAPNEVEESICRLAQMARAAGMHLVIATQRPSVNVITGVIKANIPSRIALKTSSQIDSRTILDLSGAEKLLGKGDMLFAPIGCSKPLRVQGGFASDEEIENVTAFTKQSAHSDYDENIVEQIEKIASTEISQGGKKHSDAQSDDLSDRDPMLDEAIKLVVEAGQASTSLLQRRLRLGYARAGRLIDEMEQMGIVGPHEGSKSRQVLMSHQEWLERNNYLSE
ncbi:MAG: DNA translocase FtsK [Acutalibacteraceae bacterium]